jgi:hypothetical protein
VGSNLRQIEIPKIPKPPELNNPVNNNNNSIQFVELVAIRFDDESAAIDDGWILHRNKRGSVGTVRETRLPSDLPRRRPQPVRGTRLQPPPNTPLVQDRLLLVHRHLSRSSDHSYRLGFYFYK